MKEKICTSRQPDELASNKGGTVLPLTLEVCLEISSRYLDLFEVPCG